MKKVLSLIVLALIIASCGGVKSKLPLQEYDEIYKCENENYPQYLLIKNTNDSTMKFAFFPEDAKVKCEMPKSGIAVDKFTRSKPDIIVQADGSGIETHVFISNNYKCELTIRKGFADKVQIHCHCNGGNICPDDTYYNKDTKE